MNNIKKYAFIVALTMISLTTNLFGQHNGLGLHFGGWDFLGPMGYGYFKNDVRSISYQLDSARFDTTYKAQVRWNPNVRASYIKGINDKLDVTFGLSLGSCDYPTSSDDSSYARKQFRTNDPATEPNNQKLLAELDAKLQYNLINRFEHLVSPYVFAGLSMANSMDKNFGVQVPVGVGFNFNLTKNNDLFLNLETNYKLALTSKVQNHLHHLIGFNYILGSAAAPTPKVVVPEKPSDKDGDGIADVDDACPELAGISAFSGCPDTDGDGIKDSEDKCPMVTGVASYGGCPIPDTDGDGIKDDTDKCPTVAGVARYGGCPIPDTDGDGFNDEEDKCPALASATNNGCPEIKKETIEKVNKAAGAVYFDTGKSTIKPASKKQLDVIAAVLQEDATLFCDINGHTDNAGDHDKNTQLSKDRAKACLDYLVSKGIAASRLTSEGFGPDQPKADNKTAAGRAQNRRTEFKLRNF